MDPDIPQALSRTEWLIMSAVWEMKEADALRVSGFVTNRFAYALTPKTAGIFLARLSQKGHLTYTATTSSGRGRPAHVYTAAIAREEALRFLFTSFIAEHSLQDDDLAFLRSLLTTSKVQ